ncbi:MAG: enoyl-CoA hydratase/isomerase family protein [Planctomycetota bacterium]|jgi:cyclohexa-1,5-dienecarbonyl-CoA hydratase
MDLVKKEIAHEGAILRLIVDNPKGNIFNGTVMNQLHTAITGASNDPHLKLITIEAAGKHYSFGASVEEHTKADVPKMLANLKALVMGIAESEVPVAALVQGYCLGGAFEVVLACHLVFATPDAQMGVPEIRLGVVPPVAAAMLPRKLGQAAANQLIMTGEEMSGDRLHTLGLVHSCFSADSLFDGVADWFDKTFGKFSACSLRHVTRNAQAAFLRRLENRIEEHNKDYIEKLMESHDANEGIAAFIEKRSPEWKNK